MESAVLVGIGEARRHVCEHRAPAPSTGAHGTDVQDEQDSEEELSEIEVQRLENIQRNLARLRSMGLDFYREGELQ